MAARSYLLVPLLVLLGTSSVALAGPADQVDWPKDVAEPLHTRVANIERALGLEVDYWYARPPGGLAAFDETVAHPGERPLQIRSTFDEDVLEVTILRRDGTEDGFRVNATRTFEEHRTGEFGICPMEPPGPCTKQPSFTTFTVDRVVLHDLPVGVLFEGSNELTISGPPAAFSGFGEGVDAVRGMAAVLGIPTERIDWDGARRSFENGTHRPPQVEQVDCICTTHAWRLADRVQGTGHVEATLAQGRLVSFTASPILREDLVPTIGREDARDRVHALLEEHGYGQVHLSPQAKERDHDWLRPTFLDHHGLTWRYQVTTHQGGGHGMYAEGFLDAETGEEVHASALPILVSGFEPPQGPPVWGVALVVLIAVLLTRRYDH